MKLVRLTFLLAMLCMLFQGCAYKEMTYFRKHGASLDDERRDWGLCGGNFVSDGQVAPIVQKDVISCMNAKGYLTLNDYFEEQFISFQKMNGENKGPNIQEMEACGFGVTQKKQIGASCSGHWFVPGEKVAKVTQCMIGLGYVPTIPRLGNTFRIIKDPAKLNPLFCTYLSPRSGRGGLSFGGWRLE